MADYYDLKADAGAAGDGTTDDTTELQAALDSVKSSGKRLYIPPGDYVISGQVDVDGHLGSTVYGSGSKSRFVWKGGASAPMLYVAGSREMEFRDFGISPISGSYPLLEGIRQEQDGLPGSGVSSMNRYRRLHIDGLNVMTQGIYLKGSSTDANNDFSGFDECYISGYDEAAILLEGANCLNNWITRCQLRGGNNGNYGVKSITGAGGQAGHFAIYGCGIMGHEISDMYLQTRCAQPIVVEDVWSEGSEKFFVTGGSSGSACSITLRSCNWASDGHGGTDPVIDIRLPGPIRMQNCVLGTDYSHAVKVKWDYTGGYFAPSFIVEDCRIWGNLSTTGGVFLTNTPTIVRTYAQTADTTSAAL